MQPSAIVTSVINQVSKQSGTRQGMTAVRERQAEFGGELEMMLTGIALDPASREYADSLLDDYWFDGFSAARRLAFNATRIPEVIIGSGFHAATYAATRVLAGHPRPLVIERNDRAGGTFAMSPRPVFYLNSRNRPGLPGLAGDQGAQLNYLPGAPIQAANISVGEYQTNAEMAFVIRLTLAQFADVLTGETVSRVSGTDEGLEVQTPNRTIETSRVIDARGVGDPADANLANGSTVLTFPQFMARMGTMWPLRGIRRAAVIGSGDSARCAIESLLGIGPQPLMSAAALDHVERVDWYGSGLPQDCVDWRERERDRYQRIGSYLRPDRFGQRRLNVISGRFVPTALPDQRVLVSDRSYDLAIIATGNQEQFISGLSAADFEDYSRAGTTVGKTSIDLPEVFRVGPHADIPFSTSERTSGIANIAANRAAMFRLANKTATLASSLPAV